MTRPGRTTRARVVEIDADGVRRREDRLATEEPLEIRVDPPDAPAERFGITMRTPGHDFELAAGLLLADGVYRTRDDLRSIAYCTDVDLSEDEEFNVVTVHLTTPPQASWNARTMSSACGVCGTQSVREVQPLRAASGSDLSLVPDVLAKLPQRLRAEQQVFASTGALHAAGLFRADGTPVVVREDVGRHNAVDKAIGHLLLQSLDPSELQLCVSGRIAYEIVQKAAAIGVGTIVAVGAPSSLAVHTAEHAGIALIGFVRDERMVIYTGAERLTAT